MRHIKTATITITLILILILIASNSHAASTTETLYNYDIPEYLHKYVNGINYDIKSNLTITRGVTYSILADSSYEGVITIYEADVDRDVILHEIGHIVHWRTDGLNPYKNTETMAQFFVAEANRTSSLSELLSQMEFWRRVARIYNWKYN